MSAPDLSWPSVTTTTWSNEACTSALLRLQHDEGRWIVSDLMGLRFGSGATLEDALADWADAVREFVEWSKEPGVKLGGALVAEVRAYRNFLETNADGGDGNKEPALPERGRHPKVEQ